MDILISNISKTYGNTKVFENFSVSFKKGKTYAVMGESGIGKTTLLRLIAGLEKVDEGQIELDSKIRFSYVFQENRLCEHLTAAQNIMFTNPKLKIKDIEAELLKVGFVSDDLLKPVKSFSGGMKRRVALLRALLYESNVILMDEPLTGLDETTAALVTDYIINNKGLRTLIVVTHSAALAKNLDAQIIAL